jgi:DNA-binding NarL/FixJ family response regulator
MLPSKMIADRPKARILIVDDHPIVRQGVAQIVNLQPDLQLCCEAGNIAEAIAAAERCPHDLAIVDISLEGVSGLSLVSTLTARFPLLPIVVMSFHEETLYAERALRLGAKGYIMKDQATIHILAAIRRILNGGIYLSDAMHDQILQRVRSPSLESGVVDVADSLTNREFEVLRLVGLGFGTRDIAEKLNRSVKTVETHRANIKEKLGLKTATELARFAALWVEGDE